MRPLAVIAHAFFLASLFSGVTGCETLPLASELTRPTILAVQTDPPTIDVGERAELEVLIAGPDGDIDDAALQWDVVPAFEELPVLGTIERDEAGTPVYVAPTAVGEPTGTAIEVVADTGDDRPLEAIKIIGVGFPFTVPNPTITNLSVNGRAIAEGEEIRLAPGAAISVDAVASPAPTDESDIAWFTTLGRIDLYRRTPSEYIAPSRPGRGMLYIVYRDADGGVAWRKHSLVVE